ncbi:predicted protein [Sclerotinia sclerotiorum 1980 UF-70]|uniref:Uncharacterized protein n=1 Tax=Sclerotinia sclerotiorum (strain ATCC 18683 / 1980 / Ss-1) TaxID=665079 RepID=A7F814_SCLS1|nr:predicted protein [Sclerotinia sclerotiorum 1980 UF-70]EDN98885.1 predicted protein [Sclerotinia sclerotiorum 1980 UF-70]
MGVLIILRSATEHPRNFCAGKKAIGKKRAETTPQDVGQRLMICPWCPILGNGDSLGEAFGILELHKYSTRCLAANTKVTTFTRKFAS